MSDVTLNCGFGCSSVDGCQGHCEGMTPPTSALERAPLASCPFCGCDDPELYYDGSASNFLQGGCRNPDCVLFDCFPGAYRDHDHFAEWWNRRPLEDALARRAEAAETQVEELKHEAELFDADHADQNHMVDRIADLIGLPHDQELDIIAFEFWFSANAARTLLTPIAEGR